MFNISKVKKALVHFRTWSKFTILIVIAAFLILGILAFSYKPIYSVTLNGEEIGYIENKSKMQEKINEYIKNGSGNQNVAFVDIQKLPQYKLCLLKKDIVTNDDEIYNKIISEGTEYYKYYAITVANETKAYVSDFTQAEQIVNQLKEKNSKNKENLGIVEKYETKLEEFTNVETCVASLYQKPDPVRRAVTTTAAYTETVTVASTSQKVNIGISLIRPVSGVLTSRYGARWNSSHKGIDIGTAKGTAIHAAAAGTVTTVCTGCPHNYPGFSSAKGCRCGGGYGNYVIVTHGNGVQTLYAHCTSISVKAGQKVSQGQTIATVGSTGNSTGNHLHFEVRVNGVPQNPFNYVSY